MNVQLAATCRVVWWVLGWVRWFCRRWRNGDVNAKGVEDGWAVLAVIRDEVDGHVCGAGVGGCVAWDEVGRFEQYVSVVARYA